MLRYILNLAFLSLALTVVLLISGVGGQPVQAADASNFMHGRIIDDAIFTDDNAMSESAIQSWLVSKNSVCLKDYTSPEPLGDNKYGSKVKASRVIWKSAQLFEINPKVILVTLQKEQGLITRSDCPDWRYRTAMGFACPDDGSCDPNFKGFSKQVYQGTRHFRGFFDQKDGWVIPHRPGDNNIRYHPSAGCGTKSVFIVNRATASLYSYTPYTPNKAALDSLYGEASGSGSECASYGNRNFWRDFTDWFGTTLVAVQWMTPEGSATEYVVYDGRKQAISSPDVRKAWNLQSLRATPEVWTAERVNSTSTHNFGNLTRRARRVGTTNYYFIDGGNHFTANGSRVRALWRIVSDPHTSSGTSYITPTLLALTHHKGNLTPYVTDESKTIYLVDDYTLRPYSNPTALHAWYDGEGVVAISSELVTQMGTGSTLTHNRVSSGDKKWMVSNRDRLLIPTTLQPQYSDILNVSQKVINYLNNGGQLGRFIRKANGGVYLVENGARYGMPSAEIFRAYRAENDPYAYVKTVDANALALIAVGDIWRSTIVKNSLNYFVLRNGVKHPIPTNQQSLYAISSHATAISTEYIDRFPVGVSTSPFVTSNDSPAVFLLDNGSRRGISNPTRLAQLKPSSTPITLLTHHDLLSYSYQGNLTNHVSDGTNEYLLDNGKKYLIPTASKATLRTAWGLSDATLSQLNGSTVAYFVSDGNLSTSVKVGSSYYLINNAGRWGTGSANVAAIWNIQSAPSFTSASLAGLNNQGALTRFAASADPNNKTIYTIDAAKLIGLSWNGLHNLGYSGENIVVLDAATASAMGEGTIFHGYFIKKTDGSIVILDQGKVRSTTHTGEWGIDTASGIATALSNAYLALLGTGPALEKSIKAPDSATIWGMVDGKKKGLSPTEYHSSYNPPGYSDVSSYLVSLIPTAP